MEWGKAVNIIEFDKIYSIVISFIEVIKDTMIFLNKEYFAYINLICSVLFYYSITVLFLFYFIGWNSFIRNINE
jgi:hypothetical protein